MKITRRVNSYQTHIILDEADLAVDHQKRYYAVPKDDRPDRPDNPYDNEPSQLYLDIESPELKVFNEAMNLMNVMYWKILADIAEMTYELHRPK